ncbi:E3 ubiquitin-protein ligase TRIM71-like [Mytilus edulis]|uniref:E3 ubiquitin-protein ligase TRIM71-like n=1 Tax=Mytilus edulis TaxID=6550 RepID=UPI0039F0D3E9
MASSDVDICTLCYDEYNSKEAIAWCTECEEFLCKDCEKHHKKMKISDDHKTMSIEDYHKLPQFVQDMSTYCQDHMEKFKLYCSFHACPCCEKCCSDKHKKCRDMKPLSDVVAQVKSSAWVQLLDQDLKDVKESFEEIIKYLKSRVNTCKFQKIQAFAKIQYMKNSIDELFNKLEKEIKYDLEYKHSELESEMNTLLLQLEQRANQINQLQSDFSQMTQHATELQMYVGLKEIEKTTSKAAQYIDDLKRGDNLKENNLQVIITPSVHSIVKYVKSFGDIHIHTRPSPLQVNAGREDQAQFLVPTYPGFDLIKPSMLKTLSIPDDKKCIHIGACRILPDSTYLILNNQDKKSQLWLFNNDGTFKKEVIGKLPGSSTDTCFVRNNTVAVTLGSANQIVLVDIEKKKVIKKIKISHDCYGVASDGQILVISSSEKSTIVNLDDIKSHKILEEVKANFISLFKGNNYGTIGDEQKVCCYASTGEPLWTFKHCDIRYPQGIAIDMNGFIYIASTENNSVMVVSPDGKTSKTILSESDGIKDPIAIDINRETGTMLISSRMNDDSEEKSFQKVFVFQI